MGFAALFFVCPARGGSFPACSGGSFLACSWGSFLACFPMALRCGAPAGSIFPMLLRCGRLLSLLVLVAVPASHGLPRRPLPATLPRCPGQQLFPMALCHSAAILFAMALPASSIFPMALRCSAPAGSPLCRRSPACNSFATAPLPAINLIGAPASNKPHLAEKSTPVWLAIWRTWAGFANSQHADAAFATPDNICAHSSLLQTLSSCSDRRKSVGPSAPIAYATSVSPQDEAVA